MATIKDIAKLAGVSHGTASNVLNHKGNVSTEKIKLVEEAARQLGYNISLQAQRLRKDSSNQIAIILPDIEKDTYRDFYITLTGLLAKANYETTVQFSDNDLEREKAALQTVLSTRPEYIVSFSCSDQLENDYRPLNNVILVDNPKASKDSQFAAVIFDYEKAAADISEEVHKKNIKSLAFFMDTAQSPINRELIRRLKLRLEPEILCDSFFYDSKVMGSGAIAILESKPSYDLVITSDPERYDVLKKYHQLLEQPLPLLMTLAASRTIPDGLQWRYEFDYRNAAYRIYQKIIDHDLTKSCEILPPKGFHPLIRTAATGKARGELSFLTVVSPTSEILASLAPYFKRCTGITLNVAALPYEELLSLLSSGMTKHYDLIRMDMVWLSRFEKAVYTPLNMQSRELNTIVSSFLPAARQVFCGTSPLYTLPFEPSVQMLFYRKDLFDDATLRRLYYEKNHKQLKVPETFSEYNEIARFFTAQYNSMSPTKYGATMTYGGATVAACDILPRLRNYEASIFNPAGQVQINSDKSLAALSSYLELKDYCSPETYYWWGGPLKSFANGESAMSIVFINHASRTININHSGSLDKVGSAPIPGKAPLLGGGCIGISAGSKQKDLCMEFLKWVYSDEISNMITFLGGLSPNASVFQNEEILSLYPWLRNISSHFSMGWRRNNTSAYADFDDNQFERILGNAVRNAAMGIVTAEEALQMAQEQCEKEFIPF